MNKDHEPSKFLKDLLESPREILEHLNPPKTSLSAEKFRHIDHSLEDEYKMVIKSLEDEIQKKLTETNKTKEQLKKV